MRKPKDSKPESYPESTDVDGRSIRGTEKGVSSPLGEQETLELWGDLKMEEVLTRENMSRALKRVQENLGSGYDGDSESFSGVR